MPLPTRTISGLGAGLAAALVCSLAVAPAQAAPPIDAMFCENPADPSQNLEIAPIDSLAEGDALTWKTSVKGTDVQTFDATYVTKLDGALGHDASGSPIDILLVDLDNPDPKLKQIGAWAGASGSPVYDSQGRLVGAVAYGFSEQGESVAGVTPAAAMKKIGALPSGVMLNARSMSSVERVTGEEPQSERMTRIKTVRVTSGVGRAEFDGTAKKLKRVFPGYRPLAVGGASQRQKVGGLPINGGAGAGEDIAIVPGGNVAVSYAYGYLAEASVGTVTAVCGDEVWAYGHPGSFDRSLGASIHGASAARIVPDGGASYKEIAKLGKAKGELVADGRVGVKAILHTPDAGAPTVPITSSSRIGDTQPNRATTHVSAKQLLAPAAAAQVGADAVRMLDSAEVGSAKVGWRIDFTRAGGKTGTLSNVNRYTANSAFPDEVGAGVAGDIEALQQNEFERVRITAVKISAVYDPDYTVERVTGVQMRAKGAWKTLKQGSTVKATRGKTYSFRTVLRATPGSDRARTEYVPFSVRVPQMLKRTMSVKLKAEAPLDDFDDLFDLLFGADDPSGFEPKNLSQLLELLDDNARSDRFSLSTAYWSASGAKKGATRMLTAPQLVDGGKAWFKLQVPKPKPAKKK